MRLALVRRTRGIFVCLIRDGVAVVPEVCRRKLNV